jgi:hypothetical protein
MPGIGSERSNSLSVFCPDQGQSILDVSTCVMESRSSEPVLRGSEDQFQRFVTAERLLNEFQLLSNHRVVVSNVLLGGSKAPLNDLTVDAQFRGSFEF